MNKISQQEPKLIRQGSVDFSVGYKVQTTWKFQEALMFTLEGLGATMFFVSFLFGQLNGALLGLVILMASGALLLVHLGNPRNMIYVMANFRHSWMSRGAVLIPVFIVLGLISVALLGNNSALIGGMANTVLTVFFLLLSIFILFKSGLVMHSFPAISLWNSSLLPILFAFNGLASGAVLFTLYPGRLPPDFYWVLPTVIGLFLISLMFYLSTSGRAGLGAVVSLNLISKRYFTSFYVVGIFAGTVMPMIIGLHFAMWPTQTTIPFIFLMTVARVVGDVAIRNVILKVGVYDKVL